MTINVKKIVKTWECGCVEFVKEGKVERCKKKNCVRIRATIERLKRITEKPREYYF